ncbi:adenylate/guanylate cyclase domain-containing protein [Aquincola sp. MAHUQ-54]|uniref:Adenylate/guanylate cyclase domain-containing protein n=1 Tax=Aquincola agrisoli TaxID=3119538 RepID=A0AAW9QMZ7_9BURK
MPSPSRLGARWTWWVPLLAWATVSLLAWCDPGPLRGLRHAVFDQYQRWSPRPYEPAPVLIVDIDDESLRRHGQWPWPRTRVAELLVRLQRSEPAAVALDIVFAEPDRTSPRALLAHTAMPQAAAQWLQALPDHDDALAEVLSRGRVALGFALTDAAGADAGGCGSPARFVVVGGPPEPAMHPFTGCVPSMPVLRQAAAGHGGLSFVPDDDGVVRRLPLLFNLEGRPAPSLAAEALRIALDARNYTVRSAAGGGVIDVGVGRLRLPTAADGSVWVHYTRHRPERYVPAWKVLAGLVPADDLRGRIVLVGTSAQGLLDLRFGPLGGVIPGVEVHAQALEQMLLGRPLQRPGWAPGLELLVLALGGLAVGLIAMVAGAASSVLAFATLASLLAGAAWWAFSRQGLLLDPVVPCGTMLAVFLPATVVRYVATERRQRWVRQAFARYVSPNLVDYLISRPQALELGGRRQRCSFVFSDLAGFTSVMERMDPAAAVAVLNEYLDRMIAIAFEHEGTLDRIVGDSVAIVFSAPVEQHDHEARALRCALAMQRFAADYLAARRAEGVEFCETRIGVHTGEVIVGNFGGRTIFDYRALGDPVNTASRLEGANKYLGTQLCVSKETLDGCPGVPARPIGRVRLAGRSAPVMVYQPLDPPDGQSIQDEAYAQAYAAMVGGRSDALPAFERLRQQRPDDALVRLHATRLQAGATDDLIELAGK